MMNQDDPNPFAAETHNKLYNLSPDEEVVIELNTLAVDHSSELAQKVIHRLYEITSDSESVKLAIAKDEQSNELIPGRIVVIAKNLKRSQSKNNDPLGAQDLVCTQCNQKVGGFEIITPEKEHIIKCTHCDAWYKYDEQSKKWERYYDYNKPYHDGKK